MKRLLEACGVLLLLALVGGSIAGLMVTKQRLHVSLSTQDPAREREAGVQLALGEDLAALRADLEALAEGLGPALEELYQGMDEAAAQRDSGMRRELATLRQEILEVRTRAEDLSREARLARAQQQETLERLRNDLRGFTEGADAISSASTPEGVPASLQDPAAEAPPTLTTAADLEVPAAGDPARKSFLSFRLPSQGFSFDLLQRWTLIPSLSRVGFDARSTLHDFTGVTSALGGELLTNPARAEERCSGLIAVQAATLDTGLEDRDQEMLKHLATQDHPEIRFEWTGFVPGTVDAAGMTVQGTVTGSLTIRGVTRPLSMPVEVSVDSSRRLVIAGEAPIKLSDFEIPVPSKLGLISMEDEIRIWVALRARAAGSPEDRGP